MVTGHLKMIVKEPLDDCSNTILWMALLCRNCDKSAVQGLPSVQHK